MMLPKDVQTKKIPRPPNAFILYRAQKLAEMKASRLVEDPPHQSKKPDASVDSNPPSTKESSSSSSAHRQADRNHGQTLAEGEAKMDIRTLSKRIGEMWKSEPEGVQDKYYRRAIQAQLEHSRLYPDYKYQPKQNRKSRKGEWQRVDEVFPGQCASGVGREKEGPPQDGMESDRKRKTTSTEKRKAERRAGDGDEGERGTLPLPSANIKTSNTKTTNTTTTYPAIPSENLSSRERIEKLKEKLRIPSSNSFIAPSFLRVHHHASSSSSSSSSSCNQDQKNLGFEVSRTTFGVEKQYVAIRSGTSSFSYHLPPHAACPASSSRAPPKDEGKKRIANTLAMPTLPATWTLFGEQSFKPFSEISNPPPPFRHGKMITQDGPPRQVQVGMVEGVFGEHELLSPKSLPREQVKDQSGPTMTGMAEDLLIGLKRQETFHHHHHHHHHHQDTDDWITEDLVAKQALALLLGGESHSSRDEEDEGPGVEEKMMVPILPNDNPLGNGDSNASLRGTKDSKVPTPTLGPFHRGDGSRDQVGFGYDPSSLFSNPLLLHPDLDSTASTTGSVDQTVHFESLPTLTPATWQEMDWSHASLNVNIADPCEMAHMNLERGFGSQSPDQTRAVTIFESSSFPFSNPNLSCSSSGLALCPLTTDTPSVIMGEGGGGGGGGLIQGGQNPLSHNSNKACSSFSSSCSSFTAMADWFSQSSSDLHMTPLLDERIRVPKPTKQRKTQVVDAHISGCTNFSRPLREKGLEGGEGEGESSHFGEFRPAMALATASTLDEAFNFGFKSQALSEVEPVAAPTHDGKGSQDDQERMVECPQSDRKEADRALQEMVGSGSKGDHGSERHQEAMETNGTNEGDGWEWDCLIDTISARRKVMMEPPQAHPPWLTRPKSLLLPHHRETSSNQGHDDHHQALKGRTRKRSASVESMSVFHSSLQHPRPYPQPFQREIVSSGAPRSASDQGKTGRRTMSLTGSRRLRRASDRLTDLDSGRGWLEDDDGHRALNGSGVDEGGRGGVAVASTPWNERSKSLSKDLNETKAQGRGATTGEKTRTDGVARPLATRDESEGEGVEIRGRSIPQGRDTRCLPAPAPRQPGQEGVSAGGRTRSRSQVRNRRGSISAIRSTTPSANNNCNSPFKNPAATQTFHHPYSTEGTRRRGGKNRTRSASVCLGGASHVVWRMETEGEAVPIHKTDAELEMETVKVTVGKGREASWSIDDPKPCSSGGKDQGEETRSTPDVRTGSPSETIQDGFCCCSSSQPSRPTAALERESSSVSGERKLRLNGEYTEAEILEILSQARRR